MTSFFRHVTKQAIFVAVLSLAASCAFAQISDKEGKPVTDLVVKNNNAISTEMITTKIKTKVGESFSQATVNDDLKRLYATDYFTDVSFDVEDYKSGVRITIIVEEKSVIESITFSGNHIFREPKLKALMRSKVDDMLNLSMLAQDMVEIKAFYVKKGYPLVDVKYELDVDKKLNKAKVIVVIDEGTRVKVKKITITGNKHLQTGKITKILGTKPAWLFNPGVFKDEVFQEDLDHIRSLYDDIGYLDVELVPKMDYSEDGKLLYINIDVKEGKQYINGDITIKGNLTLPEKDLYKQLKMKKGKPFSNKAIRSDAIGLRQYYYNFGYMNVTIDVERNINPDTGTVEVGYTIDSKELVYVGKVDIRGNMKTRELVIRRELRIYPGERFDGSKIKRSKERLYNRGIFEDISFDTQDTKQPDVKDLVVEVKEGKTGQFSFGGGYSSIDSLIGFVEVEQRNFDIMNWPTFVGAGQYLVVRADLGMVRRNFNISWTEPWIFGYPYTFGFDLYSAEHLQDTDVGWAYNERRTGGDLRLGKELTDRWRADLVYKFEQVEISDVDSSASQDLKDEAGTNYISSLTLGSTYDTRDNIYSPTRGFYANGTIEDAGGIFFGTKDFVKGTATVMYYHSFFDKVVVELKGRAGLANAYGRSDEVPIYERFYAGGANTIRGYRERKVGPRDLASNDPLGGEALLIGNVEMTFPIYEKIIKGAIFYDVGNVWEHMEDFAVGGEYKAGVGIGVRVKTPVGPFKLDLGYPLVKNHDDKQQIEYYFSVTRGF